MEIKDGNKRWTLLLETNSQQGGNPLLGKRRLYTELYEKITLLPSQFMMSNIAHITI